MTSYGHEINLDGIIQSPITSFIFFVVAGGKAHTWRCEPKSADGNVPQTGLNFHVKDPTSTVSRKKTPSTSWITFCVTGTERGHRIT